MKRLFVLLSLCFCFIHLGFAQQNGVIDPELYALMNSKSGEKISINIILKKQIDANKLNLRKSYSSKTAMRNHMVEELKYQAEKSQADIVKTLTASERSAQVTDVKTHWLTNMINCNATADVIYKIAEHPDVEAVIYNKMENLLFDEKETQGTPTRAYNGTNVEKINAHKVWEMGYTGEGVVVAVIDTGINADHVDLKDRLWDDGNGNHGWNTLANNSNIDDVDGHGTHCAGIVCGDGNSGIITGMAPGAKVMTIKALSDEGYATLESLVAGVEWAAAKGADILSMSVGFVKPSANVSEVLRNSLSNTLSMGIVATASAGNVGNKQDVNPIPKNITSPANCPPPWIHPDQQSNAGGKTSVICVGAVNYNDESCNFSSEGPVTWQNTSYGDYRLAAGYPTKNIRYDNSDYNGSWGTNIARTFGVMFPPSMLAEFANGGIVTSVSIHSGLGDSGFVTIYNGGNTPDDAGATALHTQGYAYNPSGEMYDIVLDKEVQIDVNKNLWVIFESYIDGSPIPMATNTDNPNGRWVKVNGTWTNNHSQITEMIKIHVSISTSNEAEEEKIGLIRPDVCAPGYQILSSSNEDNSYYKWKDGTSQAAPCVAGAIALLLDAKPDLTPAQICEVLETTAVKLSNTKSNRTGTGRIDVYEALLALSDTELVAPTLTATAASSSSINLSWTKSSSATYTVYKNGSPIATISGTTYTDTGLNPDTQYCYQVKAVKGSESKTSNEDCAITYEEGAGPSGEQYRIKVSTTSHAKYGQYLHVNSYNTPGNSTNLGVSEWAESNNQIFTLEDAGNGIYYLRTADGYYVKCGTTNIGKYWNVYAYSATEKTPIYFDYTDANNFYIRDNDKMTGANHSSSMVNNSYFKVEDSNIFCDADINGYHQTSGIKQTVTWTLELVGSSTPTAPNAPTGLATSVKGSSSIALTWNAVDGATSYNIYRNDTKIASNITATSYTDNGLTAATNYCYTVTAVNAVGESAESTQDCAETLAVGSAVEQEITIGGDISSKYYAIPINPYYNHTFSQQIYTQSEIGTGAGIITKIAFKQYNTANTPGRKIKVYMQNVSKSSFTGYYDWVAVADSDEVFNGDISLPGDGQDLEITLSSSFAYTGENLLISVCDYTGSYTSPQVSFYTYQTADVRSLIVRSDPTSYNPLNMSNVEATAAPKQNNIIDITIETVAPSEPETAPNVPTNLVAEAQSSTSISLTWDAADGATSYNVYRDEEFITSVNEISYTDEGLTPSTNYCYTVTAVNAIGESEPSEQKCAETPAEDAAFEGTITIGGVVNSSNTSGNLPTNVNYNYTFSQQIYTKDEINVKAGTIGKIAFKQKGNQPNNPTRNLKVYMQNVQKTSFAKTSDWVSVTDSDKVFEGNVNLMGPGEDFVIELSKQFAYTGEDLLISVYDCTGNYTAAVAFYTYTADSRSLYVRNDNNPYDPANMSATGTFPTVNNIIDLTFVAGSAEPTPELPDAPANLVATSQSSTSISLTWNAVDGATSYNVYRNSTQIATGITAPSYTDNNLTPSTEYCYTVTAVNTNGESEASAPACAETESDNTGGDIEDDLNGEEHLVVIGDTEYSLNELPITTYYNYGYSQQIYTKDEIGINSGTITKIAFKQSNNAIYTRSNVVVYMQNTTKASYSSGSDWVNVTDDTKVFEGSLTTPGTNGNLEITLDTPLKYTGENLLISICDESGVWNSKSYFYIYETVGNRSIYTVNDDAPYTSLNMNGSVSGSRDGYNNYIEITIMTAGSSTPEAPNAPANLVATAQSSSSIALTWDEVDGAESYNIYRNSTLIFTGIAENSYIDEVLNPSTNYCYTVKAVREGVESAASNESCATTEADNTPEAPEAPQNLVATAQSSSSISLTWSTVAGAESYNVYIGNYKLASGLETTSYTATDLESAEEFCFTVKAVREDVESAPSNESCATTPADVPSAPTNLFATAQSSSSIALTWNSVDGAESYKVYRDSQEIATNVTGTSYTDNGLTANTNYCYTVKAVNSAGESEESGSACAMTYPLAPTGLVATAESTTSIALTWNAVDGAISYNIYRNSTQIATGITVTSYTDNGLTPSTEYVYTVKAVNVAGESDASNEVRATTEAIVVDGIEQVVSIGNISNMTSTYLPFETYYTYSYSQQIYTKAEIESNGLMSGGTITKIAFKQKSNTVATRKLKVYMQNVSTASFTNDRAWVNVTDATKVFDGEVALTGAGDLVITLSLPLEYTGGNLLISVLDYTGTATSNTEFYTYGVSNRSIRFHNYGATMNPSSMSSVYGTRDGVNNVIDITFVMPILEFVGDGDWSNASNWENGVVPNSNSNVAVSGNVTINSEVVVRTITIENGGSVTLESGSLTVKDDFTNTDASAFLIEDGTQVFQTNDDVKATFLMNVLAPESWAENHTHGWQFIASPMKESMTSAFETEGIDYDLFKYVGGMDEEWVNYKGHNGIDFEETFKQGRGYIVSYERQTMVEFEGTLNHETSFAFPEMSFNEEDHFANFYLLGNPFVFNINWNDVSANDLANGYAVVTFDGNYEYAIDGDINVGDGFFVQTIGAEPSLSYGVNTRGRNSKKNNFINIIATGRDGSDNVIINFTDNDEEGFAKLENINKDIAEIYVKGEGRRYGILNYENDVEEIELYFDAKRMGEYTISAVTEGEFQSVILVDRQTGIETDLTADSYKFQATSIDSPDRFVIKLNNEAASDNFVYQSGDELIVNAKGMVQIIDVMGRIAYSSDVVNDNHRINISTFNNAAYIVRVMNSNEVKTQKIVIAF